MDVIERTAMRVVVEQRAPALALVLLGLAALGALAAGVQLLRTGEWIYAAGLAATGVLAVFGLWMCQGVRTTLDASTGVARWERLGLLPARREARLADVRGLVLLPASEDGVPTFDPVLTVGEKRWRLSVRSITDPVVAKTAIAEVLDLAKGRRAY
jgi:hypothetical protein